MLFCFLLKSLDVLFYFGDFMFALKLLDVLFYFGDFMSPRLSSGVTLEGKLFKLK
jgi:hypothetical protein